MNRRDVIKAVIAATVVPSTLIKDTGFNTSRPDNRPAWQKVFDGPHSFEWDDHDPQIHGFAS